MTVTCVPRQINKSRLRVPSVSRRGSVGSGRVLREGKQHYSERPTAALLAQAVYRKCHHGWVSRCVAEAASADKPAAAAQKVRRCTGGASPWAPGTVGQQHLWLGAGEGRAQARQAQPLMWQWLHTSGGLTLALHDENLEDALQTLHALRAAAAGARSDTRRYFSTVSICLVVYDRPIARSYCIRTEGCGNPQ